MYEDTMWHNVISNLKHFWVDILLLYFVFGLIYCYYILFSYVESTDEIRRLIAKVYNKKVIEFIL